MSVQILVGDCREVLRRLPDNHYQCVVTSPPYWGLRDYGIEPVVWGGDPACEHVWGDEVPGDSRGGSGPDAKEAYGGQDGKALYARQVARGNFCASCGAWLGCLGLEPTPDMYVSHLVDIFREARRVLRDDGVLWLNLGDCYANDTKWGGKSGGLNETSRRGGYQGQRQKRHTGLKPKDLVGIPWMVAFALRSDGWWLRSDVIWHKPNGMPESVRDRPTSAHEYIFLLSKSQRYFYDQNAIREPLATGIDNQEDYQKRIGTKPNRQNGIAGQDGRRTLGLTNATWHPGRNKRDVWTLATEPFTGAHFATFPKALVEICLKAGTSPHGCCPECGAAWERVTEKEFIPQEDVSLEKGVKGAEGQKPMDKSNHWDGTPRGSNHVTTLGFRPTCDHDAAPVACRVLDPFGGAGTTGLKADQLGLDATLIEIKKEYAEMARARIVEDAPPMFASVELVT